MAVNATGFNTSKFRVGGSSFTAFQWEGKIIGFAQGVSHNSPQPVAQWEAIQPMDKRYPVQIITPAALGAGTLRIRLFERYNSKIWDQMMNITTAAHGITGVPAGGFNDLVQVFITLAALNKPITCVKVINPPALQGESDANKAIYGDVFHNCAITDIRDDEEIDITSMSIVKNLTITYTRVTRYPGKFSSLGGDFDKIARNQLTSTTAFDQ